MEASGAATSARRRATQGRREHAEGERRVKPRTVAGLLVALLVVVLASFVSVLNRDLLVQPFRLSEQWSVPVWAVLLVVFLVGFLPVALRLALQGARRDLDEREKRRELREAESLDHSFRRALDLHADDQLVRAARELEVVLESVPTTIRPCCSTATACGSSAETRRRSSLTRRRPPLRRAVSRRSTS